MPETNMPVWPPSARMNPGRPRRTARTAIGAAIVALASLTLLRIYNPSIIIGLQQRTFDTYQRLQPRAYADFPVRIVDIDDASIAMVGQWPWPRTRLAALTRRIEELGASVVVFDILFSEPDRLTPSRLVEEVVQTGGAIADQTRKALEDLPDHDKIFADAIGRMPVVLGFAASRERSTNHPPLKAGVAFTGENPLDVLPPLPGAVTNLSLLDQSAAGVGGLNLSTRDRAGIVRRIPMLFSDGTHVYPGLAVEALRVAQRQTGILVRGTGSSGEANTGNAALLDMRVGDFTIPLTDKGEVWLYFGSSRPERHISARDLLDPSRDSELRPRLEGHIVFVGVSAAASRDSPATPLGQLMTGTEIQAQLTEQILAQSFVVRPDWADGLEVVLTVAFGILVTVLLIGFGARFSLIVGAAALAAAVAGSWFTFVHLHLLLDPIYPSLACAIVYVVIERVLRLASDTERKFVRQAFQQYLAPELLQRLESSPQAMELGGETRAISVMFMDVRGFTGLSEQLTAHELVDFINTLLSPLSDAIQSELGTIDKYIGDSIMAFWNAPLDITDHPARACRAALAMRQALRELNAANAFSAASHALDRAEVKIGVGINYGNACVGNMGSARRFNYSAIGDVVNVAARIESTTKPFGTDILVSQEIVKRAEAFAYLEAGSITLKGKSQSTTLYALVGDEICASTPGFTELQHHHAQLLDAIACNSIIEAHAALSACRRRAEHDLTDFYDHFEELIGRRMHALCQQP